MAIVSPPSPRKKESVSDMKNDEALLDSSSTLFTFFFFFFLEDGREKRKREGFSRREGVFLKEKKNPKKEENG